MNVVIVTIYFSTRKQTCIHDLGFENMELNHLISQGMRSFQEAQNRAQWLLHLPVNLRVQKVKTSTGP